MKKYLLFIAFLALGLWTFGQDKDAWLENFNNESGSQYTTGTLTINGRNWTVKDAGNFNYANSTMGSPAFTINDDKAGAHITSPALNTVGRISFKYAYKNGSSSNVFKLQKSVDGTTYTDIDTHTLGSNADQSYVNYFYDINDNTSSVYIRILSDNQNAHLFIEDYEVTNYNVGVIAPTSFTATTASTTQIDLAWTKNGNGDNVMLAWSSDGTFGTPTDGTSYSAGSSITGGGTVLYNGSATTYLHTSLSPNTTYYYQAWSVDGSTDYSTGVTDDATTYQAEPSNHVTSFTATANGYNQIDLSWSENDGAVVPDGYLIKANTAAIADPADGTDPTDDTDLTDGSGNIKVIHGTSSYSFSNCSASTTYHFKIYPYTNSGTAIDFKTTATVPSDDATTTANPDTDTEVYEPTTPIASKYIASISDTQDEAEDVFILTIQDQGSGDSYPTKVKTINLKPYTTNNAAWGTYIQGVFVDDGTNFRYPTTTITDNLITLNFAAGNITVPDGGSLDITIWVYLKNTGIIDGKTLSFMVDADDHGFTTFSGSSSEFVSNFYLGDFHSNDMTIEVTATELQFQQQPSNVSLNTNMSPAPSVAFTDENGNIELDLATAPISITASGATLLASPVSENVAANGLATFSSLQFSTAGTGVTLTATDSDDYIGDTYASVVSNSFDVSEYGSDVFISEVVDSHDAGGVKYVELFNQSGSAIDLSSGSYYLEKQTNGSGNLIAVALAGTIDAGSTYICAFDDGNPSSFENAFGNIYDQQSGSWSGNGDDPYFLYKGGNHGSGTLVDIYGVYNEDGTGKDWEYGDTHAVRKRNIINPNTSWTASEWVIVSANVDQMTPGKHALDVTWQGTTNTDWNTKGDNWSGASQYVPDASYNVTIPNTTNKPIISVPSACNNLTINSNAILSVSGGQVLTVAGSLTNNAGNSGLVLKSDVNGPSSLIHHTDNVPATVKSYFADLNKWYLISSPMSDATANVYFNQQLDFWDEPNHTWVSIEDPSISLNKGQGYSILKIIDNTATYTGSLNNGTIDVTHLDYTPANVDSLRGWNLVGNPYPSVLDFQKLDLTGVSAVAGASVWPHNGVWSSSYINYSQGGGGNAEARYIQPGQAFMFQLTADNQTLTFTNDARTHKNLALFDKSTEEINNTEESLRITITGISTTYDETYISFREGASHDFDPYYDVHKLFGAVANPHIFSYIDLEEEEKAAIQSIPQPADGDVLHLGTRIGLTGDYQLQFSGMSSFAADQNFLLVDKKTDILYELRSDSLISFTYENGDAENRFDLIFDMTTETQNLDEGNHDLSIYIENHRLYILQLQDMDAHTHIEIYDVLGQKLLDREKAAAINGIELHLPSAYYIVRLYSEKMQQSQKFFLR